MAGVKPPRLLRAFLRFFCGRYGAAVARAAILAWCAIGSMVGWFAYETWGEYKTMRTEIQGIGRYIAGAQEREAAAREREERTRADIGGVRQDVHELRAVVNDHERRVYRIEGRP